MIKNLRTYTALALMSVDFEIIGSRIDEFTTALAMRIHPGLELGWREFGFISEDEYTNFGEQVGAAIREHEAPDFQGLINRMNEKITMAGAFLAPLEPAPRVRSAWDWANLRGDRFEAPAAGEDTAAFHLDLITEEEYVTRYKP